MKKIFVILALILVFTPSAFAADYRYVAAKDLRDWLGEGKSILLVDIQEAKDFATHHIKGSLETNSYPVKSDEDRQRLKPALQKNQDTGYESVVVVCPRGKGGAKRTYDYLKEHGIPVEKLHILTGGMKNWPYSEWVETK